MDRHIYTVVDTYLLETNWTVNKVVMVITERPAKKMLLYVMACLLVQANSSIVRGVIKLHRQIKCHAMI